MVPWDTGVGFGGRKREGLREGREGEKEGGREGEKEGGRKREGGREGGKVTLFFFHHLCI